MNIEIKLKLVWVVCLWFMLPLFCGAEALPQNMPNSPCAYPVSDKVMTPFFMVSFTTMENGGGRARWICVGDKLMLTAGCSEGRENSFSMFDSQADYLRDHGIMVKRLDQPIILRMVVNESTYPRDQYNSFWLLDFRNMEPLLVGPMVTPDSGRIFSVIWHEDNVIVVFDDQGGPEGGRLDPRPDWGDAERHFVKDVEAESLHKVFLKDRETNEEINMVNLPLMNKDGMFHAGKRTYVNMPHDRLVRKGKLISSSLNIKMDVRDGKPKNVRAIYPAYYYDYKTNKLTAVAIEED